MAKSLSCRYRQSRWDLNSTSVPCFRHTKSNRLVFGCLISRHSFAAEQGVEHSFFWLFRRSEGTTPMYICQFFTSIAVAKTSQKRHEYHFCFSITFLRRGKIDTIPYQLKPSHSLSTMGKPGSQLWRKAQPTDYVSQTSSL